MLIIYTDKNHYDPKSRSYLPDILRPFIPSNRLVEFSLDQDKIAITDNIESADICMLPFAWNYYAKSGKIEYVDNFIQKANKYNKKTIVWCFGDRYINVNRENTLVFRHSSYASIRQNNEYVLPVFIRDPLKFLKLDGIYIRNKNPKPSLGFCGQSDKLLLQTVLKINYRILNKLKYKLSKSSWNPRYILPPTFFRRKILNDLGSNKDIECNFIINSLYKGRHFLKKYNERESRGLFYNNINSNDYTVCIRGGGNFSTRFYEVLALGKIPIFIDTDCILPLDDIIKWKTHCNWIDINEKNNVIDLVQEFHSNLNDIDFISMQKNNRKLWEEHLSYIGYFNNFPKLIMKNIKESN